MNSREAPRPMCPNVELAFDLQKLEDLFHLDLNRVTPRLLSLLFRGARGGKEGGREGGGGLPCPYWIKGDDASFGVHEGFECFGIVMRKTRTTGENNDGGYFFLLFFAFVPDDANEDVSGFREARKGNLDETIIKTEAVGPAWVGLWENVRGVGEERRERKGRG